MRASCIALRLSVSLFTRKYKITKKLKGTTISNITNAINARQASVYFAIQFRILAKPAGRTSHLMMLMSKRRKKIWWKKGSKSVLGAAGLLKRPKDAILWHAIALINSVLVAVLSKLMTINALMAVLYLILRSQNIE